MEKNLTSGSVFRNIVIFSLPYLLSYFLQTLYGMADLFIIGQFEGVSSTTAVSVGSQVMHMLTVMIVGLAMGSTVSIGQAEGGKRQEKCSVLHREHSHLIYGDFRRSHGCPAFAGEAHRGDHLHAGGSGARNRGLPDDLLHRHSVHHSL